MLDTIQCTIGKIDDLENRAMRLRNTITELLTPILNIIWNKDWDVEFISTHRRIEEFDIGKESLCITFSYADGERGYQYIPLSVLQADDPVQAMRDHLAGINKSEAEKREAKERADWERLNAKFGAGG